MSGSRKAAAARSSLPGCDRFFKSDKNSVKFFFTKVLHKGFFASGKIKIRIDIMIFKGNTGAFCVNGKLYGTYDFDALTGEVLL